MTIQSDTWIRRMALEHGMITPFVEKKIRRIEGSAFKAMDHPVVSYGASSYGYDITLGGADVRRYRDGVYIDPKRVKESDLEAVCVHVNPYTNEQFIEIPPSDFVLGYSNERFNLPSDVTAIVLGKSTNARCAIHLLATPGEAAWRGYWTLEIANVSARNTVRVYVNEGIGQVLFFKGEPCEVPYGDGPYQDQGPAVKLPQVGGK